MDIPAALIRSIRAGDCVAFVGAGFSAPAIPQWKQLLSLMAENEALPTATSERVKRLVDRATGMDLEAAAQILRDDLGQSKFGQALQAAFGGPKVESRMKARVESLLGIPFRAILTTNFDGILTGDDPGRDAYLGVLRPTGHRWWDQRYWNPERDGRAIVNLHGCLSTGDEIVFTRQDYRRRLYENPGYVTFLRSVMATTTVFYIGCSFSDAYLDELRSEILALIDYQGGDRPIAYALINDATPDEIEYTRRHEGIEILPYPSDNDFEAFDEALASLHRMTDPTRTLGSLLSGARIVWIDPAAQLVGFGMDFLERAVASTGGEATIDRFDRVDKALASVESDGADLIVTRWGHQKGPEGQSTAEYVLSATRARDLRSPVVVFASGDHGTENKRKSMDLGATSFEFTWEGLFQEIERIFKPGSPLE